MYIKLDLKIFLFGLIFLATNSLQIYTILMIFALIHEMSHLLMGVALGYKPETITIMPYGFKLNFRVNSYEYNTKILKGNLVSIKKLVIALAGPMSNLIMATMFYLIMIKTGKTQILNIEVENIIYGNLLIMIFNLIPIYPLDGAKIMKEILHLIFGNQKSIELLRRISWISISLITAATGILILYIKNLNLILALAYLWIIALKCEKQLELKEKIYKALAS